MSTASRSSRTSRGASAAVPVVAGIVAGVALIATLTGVQLPTWGSIAAIVTAVVVSGLATRYLTRS